MKYYNERTKELNDDCVLKAIRHAAALYEDGAIIEARDVLIEVTDAILDFMMEN